MEASTPSAATKARIVDAAVGTLREEGFRGATARSIARRGGFNQALIFYHFGSVNDLLLAALDETGARRMEAYRRAVAGAVSFEELIRVGLELYREDLASGHITVLSEMISGCLSHPELRPALVARMDPWVDFAERAISDALEASGFASLLSSRDFAFATVAFYLGIDLLAHLDPARPEPESLFQAGANLAPLLAGLATGRP